MGVMLVGENKFDQFQEGSQYVFQVVVFKNLGLVQRFGQFFHDIERNWLFRTKEEKMGYGTHTENLKTTCGKIGKKTADVEKEKFEIHCLN